MATGRRDALILGGVGLAAAVAGGLAGVLAEQGRGIEAARLFGAAAAWRTRLGFVIPPGEQERYEADVAAARALLPPYAFAAAWAAGQALTLEEAVAEALAEEESGDG